MYLIDVACLTPGCREHGAVKRIHLRGVALGVVEMPRLVCVNCGAETSQIGGWAAGGGVGDERPTRRSRTARTRKATVTA